MTSTEPARRQTAATRRVGYAIAILIDAVLLYLINVRPGWDALPFLTPDTPRVLPLVNASLIAGAVVNVAYLRFDGPRFRALGGVITTGVGLAAMIIIWRVFPFDFTGYSINWAMVLRIVLIVAIMGAAIGLLVQLVTLAVGRRRAVPR